MRAAPQYPHDIPLIVLITEIKASQKQCFEMSLSVDAHTASMARSGERAVAGVCSGRMVLGDSVTWRARHFGLPFRMTSRNTEYEEPVRFVDEQTKGPFTAWWHEHRFEPAGEVTKMFDLIRYRSPLGPVGRLIDHVGLEQYMTRLLRERNAWLKLELERRDG